MEVAGKYEGDVGEHPRVGFEIADLMVEADWPDDTRLVPWPDEGSATELPEFFTAKVWGIVPGASPYEIHLEVALEGRRPMLEALTVRRRQLVGSYLDVGAPGPPVIMGVWEVANITQQGLRAVRPDHLLRLAVWVATGRHEEGMTLDEWATEVYASAPPTRRRVLDDDHFRQVAKVYRNVLESSLTPDPTRQVAKHFHVSHSNAAKYVGEARKRGFLGPAAKSGVAGEVAPKPTTKKGRRR